MDADLKKKTWLYWFIENICWIFQNSTTY